MLKINYTTYYKAISITIGIELPRKRRALTNIIDSPMLNEYVTTNIVYLLVLNLLSSLLRN